jgi:hypothetical protein
MQMDLIVTPKQGGKKKQKKNIGIECSLEHFFE